jgi:hypothetical protein
VVATVAGNQLVFIGSWNGSEYALCATTCTIGATRYTSGQVVWSRYLGRTNSCGGPLNATIRGVSSAAAVATPLINGVPQTVVYVGGGGNITFAGGVLASGTAQVFALDALTGAVVWQRSLGSAPSHYMWSSPTVANGSVYIGVASHFDCPLVQGQMVQLDAVTGVVSHTFPVVPAGCTGGGIWGSATIDSAGAVYVATGNAGGCATAQPYAVSVLKLSATLGLVSYWHVPASEQIADGDFGSSPTQFAGTVTPTGTLRSLIGVGNKSGVYYVFDRSNIAAGPVMRLKLAVGGSPETGNGIISPSSWDGKLLYVAGGATTINGTSYRSGVRAYNPNNLATPIWQHGFSFVLLGAVSTDPGLAVIAEGAKTVVMKSADGSLAFVAVGASSIFGAPSISHGVIYQGDTGGLLHAYSVNGS